MARRFDNVSIDQVADYLILRGQDDGSLMTPAKLQKMLYYVQAWNLAYNLGPLFPDEPEAWVNGPVYVSIYERFRHTMMYEPLKDGVAKTPDQVVSRMDRLLTKMALGSDREETMGAVINAYGMKRTERLISLTHQEAPWINARKGLGPLDRSNEKIKHAAMKRFYAERLKDSAAE